MRMTSRVALLSAAFGLMAVPALAQQIKTTNQGITPTEIVIGTHQDLSGPIKTWGVPVANGMKLAVEQINAAGGINGRKLRLIIEDSAYDPKKAVLATQKMLEKDKVFSMIGGMGSAPVAAAEDNVFDAGVTQLFPLTAAAFTYTIDPAKPQTRLRFNNLPPYTESTRAALKYMITSREFKHPCIFYQDDEYGKNVVDGFNQQLAAMNIKPGIATTFKRGATDFSSQIAQLKSDGCDLVVLGTIVRETASAMGEAKKIGWKVTFLGATPTNVVDVVTLGKDDVEGLYAAGGFPVPYEDTATGKVKEWLLAYKKAYGIDANTQAVVGYNAIMTFAFYAKLAGKDLTGQKLVDAMESGAVFQDIFGSPPTKFSKTNHLASTITSVQEVQRGRWVIVQQGLNF